MLGRRSRDLGRARQQQGLFDVVKRIFDPLGITGKTDTGAVSAAEAMVDYAKETRDRAERERARLLAQLEVAITRPAGRSRQALDRRSKEHYDQVAEIDRLRVHVKDNILYYMQAIWSHEPPDQRFFRLYDLDVPVIVTAGRRRRHRRSGGRTGARGSADRAPRATTTADVSIADADGRNRRDRRSSWRSPIWTQCSATRATTRSYPLRENNYLTLHMMQDYLEVGDDLRLRDPDESGDYTIDDCRTGHLPLRQNPDLVRGPRGGSQGSW